MTVFLGILAILIPIGLGVLTWRFFDRIFKISDAAYKETLSYYLRKLMVIFSVVFFSLYLLFNIVFL